MGKYRRLVVASIIGLTFQKLQAQQSFASLEKNFNIRAKMLSHELNKNKDTLLLNSPKTIDYVYSINKKHEREIDFSNNTNSLKVPLASLSNGKHVFVVISSRMKIIFVIRVLKDDVTISSVTDGKLTSIDN